MKSAIHPWWKRDRLLAVKSTLDRFGARIRYTNDFTPAKERRSGLENQQRKDLDNFEMDLLVSDAKEETFRLRKIRRIRESLSWMMKNTC